MELSLNVRYLLCVFFYLYTGFLHLFVSTRGMNGKNVVFSGIQSKTKEYEQCLTLLFMIVDGSNLNSFGGSCMNNTSAEAEYLFWPQEEVTQ